MKKKFFLFLSFTFLAASVQARKDSLFVNDVLASIDSSNLLHYVEILSGEKSVMIGEKNVTISNRDAYSAENDLAADYIEQTLTNFNLVVHNQQYSSYGRNVYAKQTGFGSPDSVLIICAHYDDVDNPGADDNASGVAAVIEAARVLSNYKTNFSIYYVFFDEEEKSKAGSEYFAEYLSSRNINVYGAVNLDMIAWDSNDDGACEMHTGNYSGSLLLADQMLAFVGKFGLELKPKIITPGTSRSDHSSFWNEGFNALLLIEEFYGGDFNPYYHSSEDVISHFNVKYFYNMSMLAIGYIAFLAKESSTPVEPPEQLPSSFVLYQNYPNPFNPETTIEFFLSTPSYLTLKVYDLLGEEIIELSEGFYPSGLHRERFNYLFTDKNLSSGVYLYKLSAGSFSDSKKMLLAK